MLACGNAKQNEEQCSLGGCLVCTTNLISQYENAYKYLDGSYIRPCSISSCDSLAYKGGLCYHHCTTVLGQACPSNTSTNIDISESNISEKELWHLDKSSNFENKTNSSNSPEKKLGVRETIDEYYKDRNIGSTYTDVCSADKLFPELDFSGSDQSLETVKSLKNFNLSVQNSDIKTTPTNSSGLKQSSLASVSFASSSSSLPNDVRQTAFERCSMPGCRNVARLNGICVSHINSQKRVNDPVYEDAPKLVSLQVDDVGVKRKNGSRVCKYAGCPTLAKSGGLCVRHGGGKRCSIDGCDRLVVRDDLCSKHGLRKLCEEEGCSKAAVAWGKCSAHGGARYCKIEGCKTLAKSGGCCVKHGGGARCVAKGCDKLILRAGFCRDHLCREKGCDLQAYLDRYCKDHYVIGHPNHSLVE